LISSIVLLKSSIKVRELSLTSFPDLDFEIISLENKSNSSNEEMHFIIIIQ